MANYLGIDLGTTSVKICLINEEKKILFEAESMHNATLMVNISSEKKSNIHEQNPRKIISTVNDLLNCQFSDYLSHLAGIGVSGQMHGVVFWNAKSIQTGNLMANWKCSNLVTWMDQRCDNEFLQSLPPWKEEAGKVLGKIATGFGIATLAWLTKHNQLDKSFDCCGTIMDFFVAVMTSSQKAYISTQNAYSWGYCNKNGWLNDELKKIISIDLLPQIVAPGFIVGRTVNNWAIPTNTPVFVGLGDLQAYLLPIIQLHEAVIHLGTSAQMVFVTNSNIKCDFPTSLAVVPFFGDDQTLIVASSLNGGNALQVFAQQVAEWSHFLYGTPRNPQVLPKVFEKAFSAETALQQKSSLKVSPLFYGERHNSKVRATLENWSLETSALQILQEIARGTIRNLSEMMPLKVLQQFQISSIRLINKAIQAVYKDEVILMFPSMKLDMAHDDNTILSAAFGAAYSIIINQ